LRSLALINAKSFAAYMYLPLPSGVLAITQKFGYSLLWHA
jgi:hypothetical protein